MRADRELPAMGTTNTCPRCGAGFACGMEAGLAECWCAALPPGFAVPAGDAGAGCYCPDCLRELIDEALRERAGRRQD